MGVTFGILGRYLIFGSNTVFGWHELESLKSSVFDKIPHCCWHLMVDINAFNFLASSFMTWMKLWWKHLRYRSCWYGGHRLDSCIMGYGLSNAP
jgi:hypothetical protein